MAEFYLKFHYFPSALLFASCFYWFSGVSRILYGQALYFGFSNEMDLISNKVLNFQLCTMGLKLHMIFVWEVANQDRLYHCEHLG